MLRLLLLSLLLSFSQISFGQGADSLFVKQSDLGWVISHKVKAGETFYTVARRYHVPPAMLADFNNSGLQQTLSPGKKLFVPVGAYNFLASRPYRSSEARPAYYRVDAERNLGRISKNSGVKPNTILQWNRTANKQLREGQILIVGWILYDATEPIPPASTKLPASGVATSKGSGMTVTQGVPVQTRKDTVYVTGADTLRADGMDTLAEVSEGEILFMEQTNNEANVTEEKGAAAFFKRVGTSSNGIFFAFHSMAKRGTILKVHNPGTGKTVYAKVIGTVPTTATYHNALIGLSSDARENLGVFEDKAWVQVSYATP